MMTAKEPRPTLAPVICDGRTKDGRPCKKVLGEAFLAPGSILREWCDRCKKMNERET